MSTALIQGSDNALGTLETVLATGDLSKLSTEDRTRYLLKVCDSLGLNPLTRPFQYVTLSGRLTLYATRDATDQLRKLHGVSVRITSRERTDDLCIIQAEATDRTGRTDTSIGVLSIKGLGGEALANALMKCETKAKRRVTLSICGLGMLDETEVVSVPGAAMVEQPPVTVSEISASAGAPIPPLPAANLAPVPVLAGATADQRAGYLRSMHALGMDADAAMAIVRDTSGVTFEEATRGQMGTVYRAAQTGRLAQVDGRWHIVEPPAESVAEAAPLVAQLAAAVK